MRICEMRQDNESPMSGRRAAFLLAAIAAAAAMSFALATGPVSTANAAANQFCENYWLSPYGTPGDSCDGLQSQGGFTTSSGGDIYFFGVQTHERAGCVRVIGYYGEAHGPWNCTGNNSNTVAYTPQYGWYRGSIRNNNTVNSGSFSGFGCCWN